MKYVSLFQIPLSFYIFFRKIRCMFPYILLPLLPLLHSQYPKE
jgi:hypothetical protein